MTIDFAVLVQRPGSKFNSGKLLIAMLIFLVFNPANNLSAHTPYGQWDSFRERHLQVLTTRSDLVGDAIADEWVAVLVEHLPKSKAVVSRARNFTRMASLLKTDQAKVAVLSHEHAESMFQGESVFKEFGPMPLQVLVDNGKYLLVARDDLPKEHGFLVVATLLEKAVALKLTVPSKTLFGMRIHPGAEAAKLEFHLE